MSETRNWHLKGDWFDNCSCAVACPCTFGQKPDGNLCEFVLFWHVREGHFENVDLNGLSIASVGNFEGNLWDYDAKGRSGVFIDERASDAQAEAMSEIFSGRAGGWPGQFAKCMGRGRESRGVEKASFTFEICPDLSHWGVDIAGKVTAWARALAGPTSLPGKPPQLSSPPGCEVGPGQLVTWGKSTRCTVDAFGFNHSWTSSSSKHTPFEWRGTDFE